MRDLRIVFMGTPDFAVATLDAILQAKYNVVGVITAPDRKAGRGRKIQISAVKKYALEKQLNILQPTNLKNESFLKALQNLNANLQVVVAFRMLPKVVWQMPEYGTFNLHASLLPNYRGAAPINWAIINGEKETGVSTFFIDEKIDTGDLILQESATIGEDEHVGSLHDRLMSLGSALVVKTIAAIEKSDVPTTKQLAKGNKEAPKIFKDNCRIDWQAPLTDIYNLIRGLNPYPTAWTELYNNNVKSKLKIFDVSKEFEEHQVPVGTVICDQKNLKISVSDGYLIIHTLQLEGKKRMDTKSLLNGFEFHSNAKVV